MGPVMPPDSGESSAHESNPSAQAAGGNGQPLPGGGLLPPLLEFLTASLKARPELRAAAREFAAWLARAAAEPAPGAESAAPATTIAPPRALESLTLSIGGTSIPVTVPQSDADTRVDTPTGATAPSVPPTAPRTAAPPPPLALPDLRLVARRCQLRVEACRWAIDRRRRIGQGADFRSQVAPGDHDLREKAVAQPHCYLWPLDPYITLPADAELETAAGVYGNLATAAQFADEVRAGTDSPDQWESAYHLLAEAQSALRVLAESLELGVDRDQEDSFKWLCSRTREDGVFIDRHMRLNDPADPHAWLDLGERLRAAGEEWQGDQARERNRRQALNKARYHLNKLQSTADRSGADADWRSLGAALARLLELGFPPSNKEIREILLPLVDDIPEAVALEPAFRRILAEIDRYLASRESEPQIAAPAAPAEPAVREVADLLRGRVAVMIGGVAREHSRKNLRRAFELVDLRWIGTREHQSVAEFDAQIAREEVGLVLLAIRWSSHSFEEVRSMCARHGKPFVRLPRGYGVNQVAAEILSQASEQLRRRQP
jgi:hypothetical protein